MRVLFLSYYFPPMGGVGVQRALKFVKYLPQFGIEPFVISADDPNYVADGQLLSQLPPAVKVTRLRHTTLVNRLLTLRRHTHKEEAQSKAGHEKKTGNNRYGIVGRDQILRHYSSLLFPDDKRAWGRQAFKAALQAHADQPFDLILSTSPPVTSHFVAAQLKRTLGIPWVADFRDLWTANESYNLPLWRRWLDNWAERGLLRQTDGVITVTKGFAASLSRAAPETTPVQVIYNGYDDEDFINIRPIDRDTARFLLVYTGTLYGKRSPQPLLQGLEHLLEKEPAISEKLCVRFVGNIGSRFESMLNEFEQRHPGILERRDFVAHDQIPAMLSSADALLLILGGSSTETVLPAKVFEYLRAERPILFIGPANSESSRLVEETGHGIACDELEPGQIAQALKQIMESNFEIDTEKSIAGFDRQNLTRQLAEFLTEVRRATSLKIQ